MSDLKKCPFCGYNATNRKVDWCEKEYYTVTCPNCGSSIGLHETEKEAVDSWNRRAERYVIPSGKTHILKLYSEFADPVCSGEKPFEVRFNDRGFQKGDLVCFKVINKIDDYLIPHPLNSKKFEITYVISGWGINEGYVVFGISEVKNKDEEK